MRQKISIAYVFDDKFTDLFIVSAYSAAKNTSAGITVYVVDCGISKKNRTKILQLSGKCENILTIKSGQPERVSAIEKLPIPPHFSSAIFYRLAISKIFPELERVIYVDCDTIVSGDIISLWDEDLGGRPFGAVEEDGNFFCKKTKLRRQMELGLSSEKKYYNSGVLLIDCKEFERSKIFERVVEQVEKSEVPLICPEQDAMNLCLENHEHVALSPKYNFMPFTPLGKQCNEKIIPIIVHYAGAKPWETNKKLTKFLHSCGLFKFSTKFLQIFWKYANEVGFTETDKNNCDATLNFFYKRLFQPIERIASKIGNMLLDFMKKYFKFGRHG
ncbi:MAG: glycosyltransferase family 8 protein [Puniceicoccales bacterium]|jgi:lipopolysaccharide biosynthesis glycosyltransferase|nr:glycosyltransferase family 8 protein [Puniceicoccales bacterium]